MFGFSSFSELPFSTVSGTAVPPPIIIVTTGGYDDKKRFKKEINLFLIKGVNMITTKKAKRVYKEVDVVTDNVLEKIKISYATPVILLVVALTLIGLPLWYFYG